MKRLFMTFSAMLLVSVSAFAQSGNNEPLKGDVNGDGVVDVADIAALIAIIKNNAAPQTTYYWYIGEKAPSSIDSNYNDTITADYSNIKAGWHKIGSSLNDFYLEFRVNQGDYSQCMEFENKVQYYLAIPNTLHIYAADNNTNVETTYFNPITSSIHGYNVYQYRTAVYEVKGIIIR